MWGVIALSPQFGVRGGDAGQVTHVTRQVRGDARVPALTCKQRWRAASCGGQIRGGARKGSLNYRCLHVLMIFDVCSVVRLYYRV